MKKIMLLLSFLLVLVVANAETESTGNLPKMDSKSGVVVLYYGNDKVVQSCTLYHCNFKTDTNEAAMVAKVKSWVASPYPYIGYKLLGGYDCRNASEYLQQNGIGKMNIGNCYSVSFNSKGEVEDDNSSFNKNYWNDPDRVTDTSVDQLDTYGWALVNSVLQARMSELEKSGWEKIYSEYNLAGGPNLLYVGKALSFTPDYSYLAIGTVRESNFDLKLLNFDRPLDDGMPYQEQYINGTADKMSETSVFHPLQPIKKIIAAAVSLDGINTTSAGIMIYRKKFSLQDDFQAILDDAKNDFGSFKLDETKDPNGVVVFKATKVFELKTRMIYQSSQGQWMYSQYCYFDDPYAAIVESEILKLLAAYENTGNYSTPSGDYDGDMYYRLIDKDQQIVFQMVKGEKKISLNFFGNSL